MSLLVQDKDPFAIHSTLPAYEACPEISLIGPKRHFAAARQFGRFRTDADIGLDFMSTRPNTTLADF